jgi:hypothetical protein
MNGNERRMNGRVMVIRAISVLCGVAAAIGMAIAVLLLVIWAFDSSGDAEMLMGAVAAGAAGILCLLIHRGARRLARQ